MFSLTLNRGRKADCATRTRHSVGRMAPLTRSEREREGERLISQTERARRILVPSFVSEPPSLPLSSSFSSLGRHAFTFLGRPCICVYLVPGQGCGRGRHCCLQIGSFALPLSRNATAKKTDPCSSSVKVGHLFLRLLSAP